MDSRDEQPAQSSRSSLPNSRVMSSRHVHHSRDDDDFEREADEERELRRQRRMRRDSRRREGLTGRDEAVERWRAGGGAGYGERRGRDEVEDESEASEDEIESDSETGEESSLLGSSRGRGRRRARDDDLELGESAPPSRRWHSRVISPEPNARPPQPSHASRPPPPSSTRRPINIDFRFPTSFSHSGLPSYPHNQYLPLRLLSPSTDPNSPEVRRQAELREEEAAWRRNNRHHSARRDHVDADGEENLLFPALLACVLVLVPVLVITVVLGAVFTAAKVDA
ncbi:hypothetical protein OF846_000758 [Rhodotorula toruloides]|nr:hypothetical protein OF846_000758 [Rhodotorula toruloides]